MPSAKPSTSPSVSTHSHPKVAAYRRLIHLKRILLFQHTATRRWLLICHCAKVRGENVSTHSHPKVAALMVSGFAATVSCFNTQPPEGGCAKVKKFSKTFQCFNTQPPEGGCSLHKKARKISKLNTVFR